MTGRACALGILLALAWPARAEEPAPDRLRGVDARALAYTYAVGSFVAEYEPPAPGSYRLPAIDAVTDHPLVDADERRTSLFALKGTRVAVVAFIYTTCVEATGCPASLAVLHRLDRALGADRSLAGRVTLVTASFDPERDTPARMAAVRRLHTPESDWRFVTAPSEADLAPLLADFDQTVAKLRFADGAWTGLFRHVLKVYLLDGTNRVRNAYSAEFLNPTLVLNDVRTVLMEGAGNAP